MCSLSSKMAIQHVKNELDYKSFYAIAKELTYDGMTVQPIQISNYFKGHHVMSEKVASRFFDTFGITITDTFHSQGRPPEWQ